MIYKEYKKFTIQDYSYYGESELEPALTSLLQQGWEIINTYTTRQQNTKTKYDENNGSSLMVYEDGPSFTVFILGRQGIAGVIYG